MHDCDVPCNVREVERFLDCGVAAADHGHVLVAVEEPVAGGAGGHAAAHEFFLGRQAEVSRRGAGGDDQRVAGVGAGVAFQHEGTLPELHRVDMVEHDLGLEPLGVLLEALHQRRTLHAHRVGRPVVHFGRGHELAALGDAGDQHGLQVCARGVDGGGVSGGAGTEDQEAGVSGSHGRCQGGIQGKAVSSAGGL